MMTSKAFSIYFLLKTRKGLGNLWKLKTIKQEKDSWLGNSSKIKHYYFLRKLVFLKQTSLKIIIYGEVL